MPRRARLKGVSIKKCAGVRKPHLTEGEAGTTACVRQQQGVAEGCAAVGHALRGEGDYAGGGTQPAHAPDHIFVRACKGQELQDQSVEWRCMCEHYGVLAQGEGSSSAPEMARAQWIEEQLLNVAGHVLGGDSIACQSRQV